MLDGDCVGSLLGVVIRVIIGISVGKPDGDKVGFWIGIILGTVLNKELVKCESFLLYWALGQILAGSSPRCPLCPHSLVCIKNYLFYVGIGPIRDIELIYNFWKQMCISILSYIS